VIGSQNTATADPAIPRPHTKPCVVQLFDNLAFADFNIKTFQYTPPADCPGPWAKVVFVGDFNVTAGVQYDRTAQISVGYVNVFYGTTPEPSATFGPSWHVERDLTDYSALFKSEESGEANIGNLVNSTYTGIIYGTAKIEFYPPDFFGPAPKTADQVLPLPDASGGAALLASATSQLSQSFTLPKNIERAYLDVFAQGQNTDEFWYTNAPNDVANELEEYGGSGFRETEISIDGKPAGVAPVYPWIFTGGIDPFLWVPIPGVQTLNFVPYRVDLTPFAALLSNGEPHTVALSVYNDDYYFLATSTLLLYLDHGSEQVTGELTQNTVGAPNPSVVENLTTGTGGSITGTVTVGSNRQFEVAGYVNTSHGRVVTTVQQSVDFSNIQQYDINGPLYVENVTQGTKVSSKTTTRDGFVVLETTRNFSYPLVVDITEAFATDGGLSIATTIQQKYETDETHRLNGFLIYWSKLSNEVSPADTLLLNSSFEITGNEGQSSSQHYFFGNSVGQCYSRALTAANNVLTGVKNGQGCF